MAQRTRVLAEMAQKLMHLAEEKDLAVGDYVAFAQIHVRMHMKYEGACSHYTKMQSTATAVRSKVAKGHSMLVAGSVDEPCHH